MAVKTQSLALPTISSNRTNAAPSKYDFASLRPGTTDAIVEDDVVNEEKVHGRLSSAVAAYRKRVIAEGGQPGKFTVRAFTHPETQQRCIGVWRLADEPTATAGGAVADAAQGGEAQAAA